VGHEASSRHPRRSGGVGGRAVAFGLALAAASAALAVFAPPAAADELVPALSVQTGVTFTRSPGNDSDDYFVAATPSLTYVYEGDRWVTSATYAFTGSLNTVLPNGIANRLLLTAAYDVGPKTRLILGAEGLQAMVGNYLLVRRAADTQLGGLLPLNSSLLTLTATQGLTHDLSAVTRFTQSLSGTYVTSLDPEVRLNNYLATATAGIDRGWEFDAVGGEVNLQYYRNFFPPLVANGGTASLGPTWDHDFSRSVSSSVSAAGQVAFSPDPGTRVQVGPAGRASLLFYSEASGVELAYAGGIVPNLLLGTLLQSHQVVLRGYTPLSERNRVVLGVSAGYLRAKTVDLQENGGLGNEFDAVLHDVDVTWGPTDYLQLFVRYQFIGQSTATGSAPTPAIVRHGAMFGVELFGARPVGRRRLQTRLPQRVDRTDVNGAGQRRFTPPAPPDTTDGVQRDGLDR